MAILQWEKTKYDSYVGTLQVGDKQIRVATVSGSLIRDDTEPWRLVTEIPGYNRRARSFATVEEAQAKADKMLEVFATFVAAAKVRP
jgi:hypothetical protein